MNQPAAVTEVEPAKPENRELLSRALALISRRDLSRAEFVNKLVTREFDKAEVEAAADWCAAQGFLSESRYAEGAARRLVPAGRGSAYAAPELPFAGLRTLSTGHQPLALPVGPEGALDVSKINSSYRLKRSP